MKKYFVGFLAGVGILFAQFGCSSAPESTGTRTTLVGPEARVENTSPEGRGTILPAVTNQASGRARATPLPIVTNSPAANQTVSRGDVPARPEQLEFPALKYEPPNPKDYRVQLKSGPVAYIVPDRELPLVNLVVYVRVGDYLVPAGKEGLSGLTGYLLARGGTKSMTAEQLEEKIAFLAANLNSGVGDLQGTASLNLLSKDLDEGLKIFREVLTEPRFQEDKITLAKDQTMQSMRQRNDDSADIESRERGFLAFGPDFFVNRHSTAASIESLSQEDLKAFHQKWFHPENFVVAASGDFDRKAMTEKLEALFSDWPFKGEKPSPVPTTTKFTEPGVYVIDKAVNQGRVSIMLPGIKRDDPEYFSAFIMNDILGGGGFTSHIMNRVRSDEGLAYSASSSIPGGVYYPLTFTAGFQSKSRTVSYAISIVLEEMEKMVKETVTEEEINTSKRGLIDRFPRNFSTKTQVANAFAADELTGRYARDPEFWQKYRSRIDSVSREAVQNVAKRFLQRDKVAILVVGEKEEILKGHPNHEVNLKSLAGNRIVDLPLRDPLTMKPLAK